MRFDAVTEAEIQECLDHPDSAVPTIKGRTRYERSIPGNRLIVVAKPEGEDVIIVTVFLRQRRR
jgi:hypothetical protein